MITCPKCNSMSISKPKYIRDREKGTERLEYTCYNCGYTESTPTHDAKLAKATEAPECNCATPIQHHPKWIG